MGKKKEGEDSTEDNTLSGTPIIGDSTPVKLVATDKAEHHKEGQEFKASKHLADRMVKAGWAKVAGLIVIFALSIETLAAQPTQYTLFGPFGGNNAKTGQLILAFDSVTNTGTNYLQCKKTGGGATSTGVQLTVTKISGTGAGTAMLQGSNDGVTFGAIVGLGTYTITNVTTQATVWALTGSPFLYYRVSVTGSGTELITIKANLLAH